MDRILLAQADEGAVDLTQFNRFIWGAGGNANTQLIAPGETATGDITTPGGLIAYTLPWLFVLGGLILFVMLVWGSFEIMTGAANAKNVESGKKRITSALIGFLILFSSYWIAQIFQTIFGLKLGFA